MNVESFAIVGSLVAAIVGAWVALKKQREAEENSSSKRWRLYGRHLEEELDKLKTDNAALVRQHTEDAVTRARLEDLNTRLKEACHVDDERLPERLAPRRDGHGAADASPPTSP